jgi:hypothetical protein
MKILYKCDSMKICVSTYQIKILFYFLTIFLTEMKKNRLEICDFFLDFRVFKSQNFE